MKKAIKIGLIVLILLFGISKVLEWVLESRFENFINSKPDRNYNITYEDFDLHTFFTGITLNNVNITRLNKTIGTVVNGNVDFAELTGFKWMSYLFSKDLRVDGIEFNSPEFRVSIVEDTLFKVHNKNTRSLQSLFSDILSRANLNKFLIQDGYVVITQGDSLVKGEVNRLNIRASEIETDSLQLSHLIPFKLGSLEVQIESMFYQLNSNTKAKLGNFNYSIADGSLDLKNLSLEHDKNWVEISKERGIQDDVVEFELKSLSLSGVDFSSQFWNNLDVEAKKMEIDSLCLSMKRNKNLKRPKDVKKDMFKGMIDKLIYNVDLDSINITNTTFNYGELGAGKQHTGVITLNAINGSLTQFSTFPERKKKLGEFKANLTARLNNAAEMTINLEVPYDKDRFKIHTTLKDLDMRKLNSSLEPLMGVNINEGRLKNLDFYMNASFYQSQNTLVMDYEDLQLSVYEDYNDGTHHKKGFVTSLANAAIRKENLPGDKKYYTASYTTKRNIYRSPVQHIVAGVLDGVKYIVPVRGLQAIFHMKGKLKKKKKH